MRTSKPFLLYGLTDRHKDFLRDYAIEYLSSTSRTKAILHLIQEKIISNKWTSGSLESESNLPDDPEMLPEPIPQNFKKKPIQLSLRQHHYKQLEKIAASTDSSIQHYIICLILNTLPNENKLLGCQIEELRKSNYELHKIGVNINQIAKAINSNDAVYLELNKAYADIQQHIEYAKKILSNNLEKY